MRIAGARRFFASHQIVHGGIPHRRNGSIEQRHVDVLAFACVLSSIKCCGDRCRGMDRGKCVNDGNRVAHRRPLNRSRHRHHAGLCL
jgi:hypothetical protein